MKVFTFPQKKLARMERNLEDMEIGHTAILREIDRLQRKLEKAKKQLRRRENIMFYIDSTITDLKIRFGNSKSSRLNEKIKATLFETTDGLSNKRWGVDYNFVK